jgi:hypothetical protein
MSLSLYVSVALLKSVFFILGSSVLIFSLQIKSLNNLLMFTIQVLLAYTPTFSHADKVKVMRALFVFGLLVGYFTWEAFGGETDFVYFGAGSSFAAAIGALLFSFTGNSVESAAKKITKKL